MKDRDASEPSAAAILTALACGARCPCATAARKGNGNTHCPAHDDRHPSLTVSEPDGIVLFHCKTGCSQAAVLHALQALGLWPGGNARQSDRKNGSAPRGAGKVTRWPYCDEQGELLAFHCRRDRPGSKKAMWWERPDGTPSDGDIDPARLPLYRLGDVLASPDDAPVLLVEGERCADAAHAHGFVAVSLAGGASQTDFGNALDVLHGRVVVLVPDHDAPGHTLMRRVAAVLGGGV